MKFFNFLFVFVAMASIVLAETLAERAANLVAAADHVVIEKPKTDKVDLDGQQATVVADPDWIAAVSAALRKAPIDKGDHCFCLGWKTAYFYQKDEILISIAAIHGNQLRIYTKKGGGDFVIDEANWKAISAALTVSPETKAVSFPDLKATKPVWPPKVQIE